MRKVILFIAMSLDGCIADESGNVDWLEPESTEESADSYSEFIQNIDSVIMGWNTYHQLVTELSPGKWVYENMTSYVITHRKLPSTKNIIFTPDSPCDIVKELRDKNGKDIWICGGSQTIRPLIENDMIDEYRISIIPVILGAGIPLFQKMQQKTELNLVRTQTWGGIAELIYTRHERKAPR